MLQSMGSQRVGHDLATKQQQGHSNSTLGCLLWGLVGMLSGWGVFVFCGFLGFGSFYTPQIEAKIKQ